jgi:hypothetical protein
MTKKLKSKPDREVVPPAGSERMEQDVHVIQAISKRPFPPEDHECEPASDADFDADFAGELRYQISRVAVMMNAAKRRGLSVSFTVNETDGVFKEVVDVRRINVEVL